MHVELTPELKTQVNALLGSGRYADVSTLVHDALRTMAMEKVQLASITERKVKIDAELVFSRLQEAIYKNDLKPGDAIDPQAIAENLHVTPESVAKGLSLLPKSGYLKQDGKGFSVGDNSNTDKLHLFSAKTLSLSASLLDLLEVRAGLEAHGVALAVERANHDDLRFLEQALQGDSTAEHQSARDADIAFHMGIAYATHNIVYIDLIKRFYDQMFDHINELHALLYETPNNLKTIEQHHFKILNAISERDKSGARRYMMQHILFLKSFLNNTCNATGTPATQG